MCCLQLDRRRRALEYSLYSTELKKADAELADVADQMAAAEAAAAAAGAGAADGEGGSSSVAESLRRSVEAADAQVKALEGQLRELGDKLRELEAERKNGE